MTEWKKSNQQRYCPGISMAQMSFPMLQSLLTLLLSKQLPPLKMNKTEVPELGRCFHLSEVKRARRRSYSTDTLQLLSEPLCITSMWLDAWVVAVLRYEASEISLMLFQENLSNKEKTVAFLFTVIANVKYIKANICFKVAEVDLNHLLPHWMDCKHLKRKEGLFSLCLNLRKLFY